MSRPCADSDKIEEMARAIEKLRLDMLFGRVSAEAISAHLPGVTEQHFLLAIAALETAQRHMKLAHIWAMRSE